VLLVEQAAVTIAPPNQTCIATLASSYNRPLGLMTMIPEPIRDRPIDGLLDEARISGVVTIRRELAPRNAVLLVDVGDLFDATSAVCSACQSWGGGCFPIVPVPSRDQGGTLTPFWLDFLCRSDPDWIDQRGLDHVPLPRPMRSNICDPGVAQPVLAIVAQQARHVSDWTPLDAWEMDPSNPWFVSYLGTLGALSGRPSDALLRAAGYRTDLRYEDVLNVHRSSIDKPGAKDLINRLHGIERMNPIQLSLLSLNRFPADIRSSVMPAKTLLADPDPVALQHRHRIVVVYEPGSVADLCLLWNLRASFGQPFDLPLGIPATEDIGEVLTQWQIATSQRGAYLPPVPSAITSLSVPLTSLEKLAGGRLSVVAAKDVLRPWRRPARLSTDVATFENGQARIVGWAPGDRELIGSQRPLARGGGIVAHLEVQPQRLPALPFLRAPFTWPFPEGYRHGGWEEAADDPNDVLAMRWPAAWQVLEWLAAGRGLKVRPSRAGRAAVALLRRLGGLDAVEPLLSPVLIAQMERLSERKGMSWFRERVRRLARATRSASERGDDAMRAIEEQLRIVRMGLDDDDSQELVYEQLRNPLTEGGGRRAWLEWADEKGLLIRGAQLECPTCGDKYWRALVEVVPPVLCRGCGVRIVRPFPPDRLQFRYRASEPLAQAVSFDALIHLVTMRWFWRFFHTGFGGASDLWAMYPGVELVGGDPERVMGEVDVLLLMADGSLVPGECKRNASGLNDDEIEKHETCRSLLDAPWSFIATGDRASRCHEPWRRINRRPPDVPRFVLTAEHLFDQAVVRALGADPFTWREETETEWAAREASFAGLIEQALARRGQVSELDRYLERQE
jgi:hypothetical protein